MRIGVYFPKDDDLHTAVLADMAVGINSFGDVIEASFLDDFDGNLYDAAVVFGVLKKAVPKSNLRGKVIEAYQREGKHVLVLERGYVRRDEYFAAGWDGLNGRADFMNKGSKPDRWDRLEMELRPQKKPDSKHCIIVAGQVPWDASVQDTRHLEWIAGKIANITALTDREICVRPHPKAMEYTPLYFGTSRSEGDLSEALELAHAVVTYNSNVGVDALIAGVPVFCDDIGSMVYSIAEHDVYGIETPILPDREQWANDIAYAQWNKAEMRDGMAWAHLRRKLDD